MVSSVPRRAAPSGWTKISLNMFMDFCQDTSLECIPDRRCMHMSTLFMVNVPHNVTDNELSDWVQSVGIEVKEVRLIRDLVAGVSPSFAYVEIAPEIPV